MRRSTLLTAALILTAWVGALAVKAAVESPFTIRVATSHVTSAPVKIHIESRYDPAQVHGTLCVIVDSAEAEAHVSCWDEEGAGPALHITDVVLEHAGEYIVQMQQLSGNGQRRSNVENILLQ